MMIDFVQSGIQGLDINHTETSTSITLKPRPNHIEIETSPDHIETSPNHIENETSPESHSNQRMTAV